MAKRKPAAEPVKPSEVEKQIGKNKLRSLLAAARDAYKDSREIAGGLGQKVSAAIEHDNLHKKAFATLRSMDRMTPEKLADYWDTLQFYVDLSGLGDRAKSAPRMRLSGDEAAGEEEEGEDEGAGSSGTVEPFPDRRSAH